MTLRSTALFTTRMPTRRMDTRRMPARWRMNSPGILRRQTRFLASSAVRDQTDVIQLNASRTYKFWNGLDPWNGSGFIEASFDRFIPEEILSDYTSMAGGYNTLLKRYRTVYTMVDAAKRQITMINENASNLRMPLDRIPEHPAVKALQSIIDSGKPYLKAVLPVLDRTEASVNKLAKDELTLGELTTARNEIETALDIQTELVTEMMIKLALTPKKFDGTIEIGPVILAFALGAGVF